MIRLALFCGLILTTTCFAADDKKEVPKELMPFQGAWKVVKVELDGKSPPGGLAEEVRFTFTGNKLSIKEGKGNPDTGTYSVNSKKEPAEINLVNSMDKKVLGIYKFEKDGKLTVSYSAMRPKKFGEAAALLIVLEKVKEE